VSGVERARNSTTEQHKKRRGWGTRRRLSDSTRATGRRRGRASAAGAEDAPSAARRRGHSQPGRRRGRFQRSRRRGRSSPAGAEDTPSPAGAEDAPARPAPRTLPARPAPRTLPALLLGGRVRGAGALRRSSSASFDLPTWESRQIRRIAPGASAQELAASCELLRLFHVKHLPCFTVVRRPAKECPHSIRGRRFLYPVASCENFAAFLPRGLCHRRRGSAHFHLSRRAVGPPRRCGPGTSLAPVFRHRAGHRAFKRIALERRFRARAGAGGDLRGSNKSSAAPTSSRAARPGAPEIAPSGSGRSSGEPSPARPRAREVAPTHRAADPR
jgi:hypothetical protein